MVYEDFTGFTEVDTNRDLSVTSDTITITTMRQDADGTVYKDYGVDFFENFTALYIDNFINEPVSDDDSTFTMIGMSNDSRNLNWREMWLNEDGWIVAKYMHPTGASSSKVLLRACDGMDADDTAYSGDHDTTYLICHRNGTLITVDIYDDPARTVLWDTLNVDDPAVDYRYLLCGASYHCVGCANASKEVTGSVSNLCLEWPITPTESIIISEDIHFGGI